MTVVEHSVLEKIFSSGKHQVKVVSTEHGTTFSLNLQAGSLADLEEIIEAAQAAMKEFGWN